MNKLPKDSRNKLILVAIGAAGIIALFVFFVIGAQLEKLKEISDKISMSEDTQHSMKKAVENRVQIETDLKKETKVLADLENDMASGDLFAWMVRKVKEFTGDRPVQIPEFTLGNPAGGASECTLLPRFPYHQVTLVIGGSAYYNDFGKFVADFENTYPYMRILNLQVFPHATPLPADREKVGFKMEIVTLTKLGS